MITKENVISITDLRKNTKEVIRKVGQEKGPFYIMSRSKPKAVILDLDRYNTLEEALEDLYDIKTLLQAEEELKSGKLKTVPLENVVKKLKLG